MRWISLKLSDFHLTPISCRSNDANLHSPRRDWRQDGDGFSEERLIKSVKTPDKPSSMDQSEGKSGDLRGLKQCEPKRTDQKKVTWGQCGETTAKHIWKFTNGSTLERSPITVTCVGGDLGSHPRRGFYITSQQCTKLVNQVNKRLLESRFEGSLQAVLITRDAGIAEEMCTLLRAALVAQRRRTRRWCKTGKTGTCLLSVGAILISLPVVWICGTTLCMAGLVRAWIRLPSCLLCLVRTLFTLFFYVGQSLRGATFYRKQQITLCFNNTIQNKQNKYIYSHISLSLYIR